MKKRWTSYLVILLVFGHCYLFTSCTSGKNTLKTEDTKALAALETVLEQKVYRIDIQTIYPLNTLATTQVLNALLLPNTGNSASRINVRGAGHFIALQDSIATSDLPFFGEQQMSTGNYGGRNPAIQFDGMPTNYSVKRYKKKDAFIVAFTTQQKNHITESFRVSMTVFLNGYADITVLSSHRNFIRYDGELSLLETPEE